MCPIDALLQPVEAGVAGVQSMQAIPGLLGGCEVVSPFQVDYDRVEQRLRVLRVNLQRLPGTLRKAEGGGQRLALAVATLGLRGGRVRSGQRWRDTSQRRLRGDQDLGPL